MIRGRLTILDIESDEEDLDLGGFVRAISNGESLSVEQSSDEGPRPKPKKARKLKPEKPTHPSILRDRKFGEILDVLNKERRRVTPESIRMIAERLGYTEFL